MIIFLTIFQHSLSRPHPIFGIANLQHFLSKHSLYKESIAFEKFANVGFK
ncbi:033L [Invertebrate iridescent virus Kaz2018]|uniref:Uncharacterized protein n=1 Tax=Iridovirus sp. TaxID=135728 RepID=A0AAU7YCU0_9VIRU|nr:033L [Invertebrate iridescent virus Kaz2018]